MSLVRVLVCGGAGRMGAEALRALDGDPGTMAVGAFDREAGSVVWFGGPVSGDLEGLLAETQPDVVLELTHFESAVGHAVAGMRGGAGVVVGTSGLGAADLEELGRVSAETGRPCLVAPNFAVGALLMMRLASEAARFFPYAEIVETHHELKRDAPSGTAVRTAELIGEARGSGPREVAGSVETIAGARGARVAGVPVHSLRMPAFVATQEVVFSGAGERLVVRHESLDRGSFMPGVLAAVKGVLGTRGLTVGLERVLWGGSEG